MDDELRAAYGRLEDAIEAPGGAVALVASRVHERRRRRRSIAVIGGAAAVLLASGVTWGLRDGRDAATPAPAAPDPTAAPATADPTVPPSPIADLTCSTDERATGVYDYFSDTGGRPKAEIAAGYRNAGSGAVVQGSTIYLLREDGSAFAALHLAKISDGWRVASDEVCAGDSMPSPVETVPPTTRLDVDCEGATWRVGTVVNADEQAAAVDPEQAVRRWLVLGAGHDVRRVDENNAVASLLAPDGRLYGSVALTAFEGRWRVRSVSACTTEFPGLEPAEVFGSGLPLVELVAVNVGHCWVETLEHVGEEWDLRDEDQFGWGGLGPDGFLGIGAVSVSEHGQRLDFVDLSGARLQFVPADSPGTDVNQGGCA
jgi:hypothetical protein